jgi:hypothetical protein
MAEAVAEQWAAAEQWVAVAGLSVADPAAELAAAVELVVEQVDQAADQAADQVAVQVAVRPRFERSHTCPNCNLGQARSQSQKTPSGLGVKRESSNSGG